VGSVNIRKTLEGYFMAARFIFMTVAFLCSLAMAETPSNEIFLYNRPEMFSFWRTAPTNSFLVPISFPERAVEAELSITGVGYSSCISEITREKLIEGGMYRVTLPQASKNKDENIYSLRLEFDDGTVRSAELAVICGVKPALAEGSTQMILPESSRKWRRRAGNVLVPVPYGAKTLEIDGKVVAEDLDGAATWRLIEMPQPGERATYAIGDGENILCDAELEGKSLGGAMIVR
jgi:hypothetical protein